MAAINEQSEGEGGQQLVSSRYSIVIAAAKRARQIINQENAELEMEQESGSGQSEKHSPADKPLSIAIKELMDGDVKILPDDGYYDEDYYGGAEAMGDVMYEPGDADDYTEFNDDSTERYDEYEDAEEFGDDSDQEDDLDADDDSDDEEESPLDDEY